MEESQCRVDDAAIGLTEMMYLKRPYLGRQVLHTSSSICTIEAAAHIKVYSYYEIDHTKLSPKTPDQLKLIRVVMVTEKSKTDVSLRFPSIASLHAYFNDGNCTKPERKKLPALDEKYVMGSELAGEVLYRRIPPHEFAEKRNLWSFWVFGGSMEAEKVSSTEGCGVEVSDNEVPKKGLCLSAIKCTGMVTWGQRRQVRYLGWHVEERNEQEVTSNVKAAEEEKGKEKFDVDVDDEEGKEEVDGEEEEEEEEEEDEKEVVGEETVKVDNKLQETKKNLKRKCRYPSRNLRPKRAKCKKQNQIVVYKRHKKKVIKNSIDRWSVERYKLAEENMLKIMKEKGALFGKPILRPALRSEARKLIGDTGLLDHLLKHMAGKVAPGGKERFRRRHNADGAMEYWLENADLVNIRNQVGVQDPYWTPLPGWKLGDNPTQDPICAKEIKQLKEEVTKIKRDLQELVSKRQDDDLAIVATPNSCVSSQNLEPDNLLLPLKEMYIDLVNRKAKIEEQLMEISQSLIGIEEDMGKLKSTVEEPDKPESTVSPTLLLESETPPSGTEREMKEVERKNKGAIIIAEEEEEGDEAGGKSPTTRAAKIERLKSGFRICKPQGSFLWPNMVMSPQAVVPTPPSVNSSSIPPLHLLPPRPPQQHEPLPTSPVKPLAERKLVTVALSSPLETTTHYEINTTTAAKNPLINLNEVPSNQNDDVFSGSQSHNHTSFSPLTYQRRHQNVTTSTAMPRAKKELNQWEGGVRKEMKRYCEQQQRKCSSSSSSTCTVGAWLALATPNSTLDNICRRG